MLLRLLLLFGVVGISPLGAVQPEGGRLGLRERPCPARVVQAAPVRATCHLFVTPEDPDDPGSPTVTLTVTRIAARGMMSRRDPVFLLHGGPGSGQHDVLLDRLLSLPPEQLRAQLGSREWVVFDQRGVGRSDPRIGCRPEAAAELDACAEAWTARGVRLDRYNSIHSAGDVERLRRAFGYGPINVYGISYGSRLAHTFARLHPSSVRAIVHDGPMRPDNQETVDDALGAETALREIARDYARSNADSRAKNLWRRFEAGLTALARRPAMAGANRVDDATALSMVRTIVYNGELSHPADLPAALHAVAVGDFDKIAAAAHAIRARVAGRPGDRGLGERPGSVGRLQRGEDVRERARVLARHGRRGSGGSCLCQERDRRPCVRDLRALAVRPRVPH